MLLIIFILLLIGWQVYSALNQPKPPLDFNDHIRSDVGDLKFTVPKAEDECLAKRGLWKKIGIRPVPECNLPTTDGGKICEKSSQCEGVCLADTSKDELRDGMKGKIFKTSGKCSEWIKVVGCRAYVYDGFASIICAD